MVHGCPACRTEQYVTNLEVVYDYNQIAASLMRERLAGRPPTLWRYAELLPVGDPAHIVSLGEGMTPLISIPKTGRQSGVPSLYLKNESANPTWSFKDRLCSVACRCWYRT
jgi:threonine synthase